MDKIFQAIGTPNEETWGPEVTALPGWKSLRKNLYKSQLEKFFKDWDKGKKLFYLCTSCDWN